MTRITSTIHINSKLKIYHCHSMILLVAAALNHYFSKPDISLPRKSLAEFPIELGDWTAIS